MNSMDSEKKTIFITRHGRMISRQDEYPGRLVDNGLDEDGITQAQALGKKLNGSGVEIILSSNLLRSIQTAKIVSSIINKEVHIVNSLAEVDIGTLEGQRKPSKSTLYEMTMEIFGAWRNSRKYEFPDGEALTSIRERHEKVLNYIWGLSEKKILIVSHKFFLSLLVDTFTTGCVVDDPIDHCSLSEFFIRKDEVQFCMELQYWNRNNGQ